MVGDPDGKIYPLVVSENMITVGSTGVVALTVSLSQTGATINGELTDQVNIQKPPTNIGMYILLILGLLLIILIIFFIIKRKHDKEEDFNDE